jgi:hypothetical protein
MGYVENVHFASVANASLWLYFISLLGYSSTQSLQQCILRLLYQPQHHMCFRLCVCMHDIVVGHLCGLRHPTVRIVQSTNIIHHIQRVRCHLSVIITHLTAIADSTTKLLLMVAMYSIRNCVLRHAVAAIMYLHYIFAAHVFFVEHTLAKLTPILALLSVYQLMYRLHTLTCMTSVHPIKVVLMMASWVMSV